MEQAKRTLNQLRESRTPTGFDKVFVPGSLVVRHTATKEAPVIDGESRYLQNHSKHILKVLDSCPYSVLTRNQSNGSISTCTPSQLRKINLLKDKNIEFPKEDRRFINSMSMSRHRHGNQAQYELPPGLLGPLPGYQTPQIADDDPAAQLVAAAKAGKSKRLQIREDLNRILRYPPQR